MIFDDDIVEGWLNTILGGGTYTGPGTVYLGILTDDPGQDGTGYTEAVGSGYARVSKTNNTTNFPNCTPGSRQKANGTVITWPTAGASWGVGIGVGVFAGSTGGDCLAFAAWPAPETINTGNVVSMAVGQLVFEATV